MELLKPILILVAMIGAMGMVSSEGYITKQKAENMKITKLVKELRENRVSIK